MKRLLVAVGLFACLPLTLRAADIAWDSATLTTNKAQLVEGVVELALNGGSQATVVTAGGAAAAVNYFFSPVSFAAEALSPHVFTATVGGPSPQARLTDNAYTPATATTTGDAGFDAVIGSFVDAYGTPAGITAGTLALTGLTPGGEYRIQVFYNDQRDTTDDRVMTFGDGNGHTVDIAGGDPAAGVQSNHFGAFARGTFKASGTNQDLSLRANGFGNVHFNAVILARQGAAPPPETPTGVVATPGDARVTLDWNANRQAGFHHFDIARSTIAGGSYTSISETVEARWIDAGLSNGVPYYYTVTAVNQDGIRSAPSDEVEAKPNGGSASPPNILFIVTDDQDTYSVGAYRRSEPCETKADGAPYVVRTPNIDRLAAEGMLFHQARIMGGNSGAVCTPSRTMIMTGRSTWRRTDGVSAATTLPGVFNRNGYETFRTCKLGNSYDVANGEFSNGLADSSTKRGNTDGNGSEWHANRVLNYLDDWDAAGRNKPFLVYLGFSHPHDTRLARPELLSRYGCVNESDPSGIALNTNAPPLPASWLACTPETYPAYPFNHGDLNVRDENTVDGVGQYRTEAVVRNEIGRYFACVDWIDQQVGRVLDKLDALGVATNTYVVFTSDHGIAIGRHGLQGKQNLYEHTLRVPYIVRGPGVAPGSETEALIYLHDTFPTLCDLAGIAPPPTLDTVDGRSFAPVLRGTTSVARDVVYGVYAGGDKPGIRSVTDGRWKLIKYDVDGHGVQVTQLFDLLANPFELLPEHGVPNLATQPAYVLVRQELEEQLMRQRKALGDPSAFVGDRVLYRFEEGAAGREADAIDDGLPWLDDGTAYSGNGGTRPVYTTNVPAAVDAVVGAPNRLALDFERDVQNYIEIPDSREFDFGGAPFTIEAWVRFETMPDGANMASRMPLVMKKIIGAGDADLDYLFLAAAGDYGSASNYGHMALHLGGGRVISSLAVPDTDWHYIGVAFDPVAGMVCFTLDDDDETVATSLAGTVNAGPLVIGAHFNSSGKIDSAFDGLLDEVSVTAGFLARGERQPLAGIREPSPFRIVGLAADRAALSIWFESDERCLYDLQTSPNLSSPDWTFLRSFIGGSPGAGVTELMNVPHSGSCSGAYFRVSGGPPRRP